MDPKAKLDTDLIEARYQYRAEVDQERVQDKAQENKRMEEALTLVSRVTFRNKYGYDDYEGDDGLSLHIKPADDEIEMAKPAPFDSFKETFQ